MTMSRFQSLFRLYLRLPSRVFTTIISPSLVLRQNSNNGHCNFIRAVSSSTRNTEYISFVNTENDYASSILDGTPEYARLKFRPDPKLLEGKAAAGVVLHPVVQQFIELSKEEEPIKKALSDPQYEQIVSQLGECVSSLDDTNLLLTISCMANFPRTISWDAPNFFKLWKLLDTECLQRYKTKWTLEEAFQVDDAFTQTNIVRRSEFHWNMTRKCFRRCDKLSKEQFLRFLFMLNKRRSVPKALNSYELEYNLVRWSEKMSVDEFGVAAMAFFKTETTINSVDLINTILNAAIQNAETLNPIAVAAIAKVVKLSRKYDSEDMMIKMFKAYTPQLSRLSIPAAIHLALMGTHTGVFEYGYMTKLIEFIEPQLSIARLKELERLTLALGMFNIPCHSLLDKIIEEIRDPARKGELEDYGRSLPALLHYISYSEIYPKDLISTVLDPVFLKKYYGSGSHLGRYQREILCLDLTTDIEMSDYSGNRLSDKTRNYILKTATFYFPEDDKSRRTKYQLGMQKTYNDLENIFNAPKKPMLLNILPQFRSAEVLFCTDKNANAVDVPEYITKFEQHELKIIPESARGGPIVFHAFILINRSNSIFGSKDPIGSTVLRERQLRKLGYTVHKIYDDERTSISQRRQILKHMVEGSCQELRHKGSGKLKSVVQK